MRTLTDTYKTWKNTVRGNRAFVWLLELWRDATNVSRYVFNRSDVTFGGNTYTKKEFSFEPPQADSAGTFHDFGIGMGAADQVEIAYLMAGKYRDQRMSARLVNLADLSNAADQILFRGKIKSASGEEKQIVLRCGMHNLRKATCPREVLYALRCRFRYEEWRCLKAAGPAICDLKFEPCRDIMDNVDRFGGLPLQPTFRP
jgi:hypothetical protein